MLDLDMIFGMREQMLPTQGFWGFVLEHWLTLAIALMAVGFLLDQVLYVVRYRPQDKWKRRYYDLRNFLTEKFGLKPVEEKCKEEPNPLYDTGVTMEKETETDEVFDIPAPAEPSDAPVIRRGGAQFAPNPAMPFAFDEPPQDDDAPTIIRAAIPADKRGNAEPNTKRPQNHGE